MGYSYHIPLRRGLLKIKSRDRLRYEERYNEVPVWSFMGVWFVYLRTQPTNAATDANPDSPAPRGG